jgi:hypothetical protein
MESSAAAPTSRSRQLHFAWLILIGFALLMLRAWPRLLHPEVWAEDGTQSLASFLTRGPASILRPVNGYLILLPKLLTVLSASISLTLYPVLSTVLAWAFEVFVFVTIARAPTLLRGGPWLAIACMLVPSDPEVFGLPLYTFWWSALLLFLLVLWDPASDRFWFRLAVLSISSLSSPVCLVTLPLFIVRAIALRNRRRETLLAITATAVAAIQAWVMLRSLGGSPPLVLDLPRMISLFLGYPSVGDLWPQYAFLLGCVMLGFILVSLVRNHTSLALWILAYLWISAVAMSLARVGVQAHPVLAGPRYFFLPFILLSWMLLQISSSDRSAWIRNLAWAFLMSSAVNAWPHLTRTHDDLDWAGHLRSCPQFTNYALLVHFDGTPFRACSVPLEGDVCARGLKNALLSSGRSGRTYPFRIVATVGGPETLTVDTRIAGAREELAVSTSWDSESGPRVLHLRRSQRMFFRANATSPRPRILIAGHADQFLDLGPFTTGWALLEFSNRLLPEEFDVLLATDPRDLQAL